MSSPKPPPTKQLQKELYDLQTSGTVVWANVRKSRRDFYKHIAEIYFWWLEALEQKGYLEAEYAKIQRPFKEKVKKGINFAKLLTLVWGNNNCSSDELHRYSRALNQLCDQHIANQNYYAKDGVAKMAQFIEDNGGINGLTGYGKKAEEENEQDEESIFDKLEPAAATEKEKFDALFASARNHYSQIATGPTCNFNASLPTTDDNLAVVLVRKTDAGYELLGSTNDKQAVEAAAVVNYKHTFSALPPSVRGLIETLRTQSLPAHILKYQRQLVDKSKQKHEDGTTMLSMRRLLYRNSSRDFLLSPVRAKTGVVTVAKLKAGGLEQIDGDVFLSTRARVALEQLAISNYEFNLYKAGSKNFIKQYKPGSSASHIMRLQSIVNDTDYLNLDFWQYDEQHSSPLPQVDIDSPTKTSWKCESTLSWFRNLHTNIVSKWFAGHAKNIKREHQSICKVELNKDELAISFVFRNGVFEYRHAVPLAQPLQSIVSLNLNFLTQDLMPVLGSIADLEVIGTILVIANPDYLRFVYETDAANFTVSVPVTNEKGVRSTKAFSFYQPSTQPPNPFENADEEFDFAAEAALMGDDALVNKIAVEMKKEQLSK